MKTVRRVLGTVAAAVALTALWLGALLSFTHLSPPAATAWVVACSAAFLGVHASGVGPGGRRRVARARVRPLGRHLRLVLRATPAVLAVAYAANALAVLPVIAGLLSPPRASGRLADYANRPGGWVPVVLVGVLAAPVVEEFFMRGWLQRSLERAVGAPTAIGIAAVVFAAIHAEPARLVSITAFALVVGYLVYATRSVWAGVVIHVANNAVAIAAGLVRDGPGVGHWRTAADLALLSALFAGVAVALHRWAPSGDGPALLAPTVGTALRHPIATAHAYHARVRATP